MKKSFIVFTLLLTFCFMIFSQENSEQKISDKNTAPIEFSVLDADLLVHSSKFFSKITDFQTPQGEKIAYKKVNEMLHSVAENEKLMKEYNFWHTTSFICGGILCASLATTIVYCCADNLPYTKEVLLTTITAGSLSFLGGMLSNYCSTSKYLQAVDNYNLNIVNSAKK